MRQIVPFKKDLLFKTKVSEITSISLEHNVKIEDDTIGGEFFISGDYKMTEGSINREKFDFKLPFDIALDSRYIKDSLVVDIDNFYYQVINNDTLQVNIDLYVDGEKMIEEREKVVRFEDLVNEIDENKDNEDREVRFGDMDSRLNVEFDPNVSVSDNDKEIDFEMGNEAKIISDSGNTNVSNVNASFNIFDKVDDSETYRAYYVYIVKEGDSIDQILEKYNISKEDLARYNDLEGIKMGDKIIIPSKNE